jgi:hypothetical protein
MYIAVFDKAVLNTVEMSEPRIAVLMVISYEYLKRPVMGIGMLNITRGLSPRANYTDRAAAAGRRS